MKNKITKDELTKTFLIAYGVGFVTGILLALKYLK